LREEKTMNRVDGTAARQLDFLDDMAPAAPRPRVAQPARPGMRVLRKDIYAELARRRRRAQIAARHELDKG
jgi:hypothetical protein